MQWEKKQQTPSARYEGGRESSRCSIVQGKRRMGSDRSNRASEVWGSELSVTTQTEHKQIFAGHCLGISEQRAAPAGDTRDLPATSERGQPGHPRRTLCLLPPVELLPPVNCRSHSPGGEEKSNLLHPSEHALSPRNGPELTSPTALRIIQSHNDDIHIWGRLGGSVR